MSSDTPHIYNKTLIYKALADLAAAKPTDVRQRLQAIYHPEAHWRGSHPLNEVTGIDAIEQTVWRPLLEALPDLERRELILIGGAFEGRQMVATVGHLTGTFTHDWLTIPATGRPLHIRYGEVHVIEDGLIIQSTCLWDILDVMRQAGFWPLTPSLGLERPWQGPITGDGIVLYETDPADGVANIAQTLGMHKTLGDYDDSALKGREGLLAMPQRTFWHPKMMWYGPAGIGTTRGLTGFVDYHQLPFRTAFPNQMSQKQPGGTRSGGHYVQFGDGKYSVTGGWPSVVVTHLGSGFLGLEPTGRKVNMRVMDFYLHHEGLIRENWVPLDILDLLMQLDVDVFDALQPQFKRGKQLA